MPKHIAPTYPLEQLEFRRALKAGLGRAWVQVMEHDSQIFRSEILEAATVCQVYDPQCEGYRESWLAKLCVRAELVADLVARPEGGEDHDRSMRCQLLKEFARLGYAGAREALYLSCQPVESTVDFFGCEEIIELDGESGLAFVARKLGEALKSDPEFWVWDWEIKLFDEQAGEGRGDQVLGELAADDPDIARYLKEVNLSRERDKDQKAGRGKSRQFSPDVVIAAIKADKGPMPWLPHWGRGAASDELDAIIDLALTTSESRVIERALRCLVRAKSYRLRSELFVCLQHADEDVRRSCARALGNHVDERVGAAGREMLAIDPIAGLALLKRNAADGDTELIEPHLCDIADECALHQLCTCVVDLLEGSKQFVCLPLALFVYEKSPCANCREEAVEAMLRWNRVPGWLAEEARCDGAEEIRALFEAPLGKS